MALLDEIGIGLYGIGDVWHNRKTQKHDLTEQQFANEFQRVMSMPDGEGKEAALDQFIMRYGGEPDANQAVSEARNEQNKLDRALNVGLNYAQRLRTEAPGSRQSPLGYNYNAANRKSAFEGMTVNTGLRDVSGMMGNKVYDAQEQVTGNSFEELANAFKTERQDYDTWKQGIHTTIDQVFKDKNVSHYLPESMTPESLKAQLDAGNGVGLWYLNEGLKSSHAVFGKTQEFADPRMKDMREMAKDERVGEHTEKAGVSHSFWLKRRAISQSDKQKTGGSGYNIAKAYSKVDINKARNDMVTALNNYDESINSTVDTINGLLGQVVGNEVTFDTQSVGGTGFRDLQLGLEVNKRLQGKEVTNANYDTVMTEVMNGIAKDYGVPVASIDQQYENVESTIRQLTPESISKVETALEFVESEQDMVDKQFLAYAEHTFNAGLHSQHTSNTPELRGAAMRLQEESQKIEDGQAEKGNPAYRAAERAFVEQLGIPTSSVNAAKGNFTAENNIPEPPGFIDKVGQTVGGWLGGGDEEPQLAAPPSANKVSQIAYTFGDQDGKLSDVEIDALISPKLQDYMASQVGQAWLELTPEQRKQVLQGAGE